MSAPLLPGAGQPPIVEFHGVGKTYPGAPAPSLQDIGLGISSGEVFGMIGRSGAGKSSLLRLVNRLESPTVGSVRVHGEDIGQLDAQRLRALRRRVGMIFQHFNLISVKTVWQNVAMPLLLAGLKGEAADARVREALQLVGLSDKLDAYPGQLSGGQKQRVGIARALVNKPDILLCDEATSALDPETTVSILELLREINRSLGLTIVLITHEMDVIRAICDRVLVLDQGRAAELGPVWQVFGNPQHAVTRGLLDRGDGQLPADLGHRLRPTRPAPADTEPEALLQLRFSGEGRHEPDLLALAHSLGTPARLRHARIERIQGRALGEWLISSPLAEAQIPPTLRRLGRHADTVELLGFLDDPGTPPPTRPLPRSAGAHA